MHNYLQPKRSETREWNFGSYMVVNMWIRRGEKEKMKIQKEREERRQKDSKIFFIV